MIHTPFREQLGTPIQSSRAGGAKGVVEVFGPFLDGLKDIEGFDRLWLLYWLHEIAPTDNLVITPFLDSSARGVFSTRSPLRPAAIGLSPVRLMERKGGFLDVLDVDMLDSTPLLDIKPYVPEFDSYPGSKAGWFDHHTRNVRLADSRFARRDSG